MRNRIFSLIKIQLKMQYADAFQKPSTVIGLLVMAFAGLILFITYTSGARAILNEIFPILSQSGNEELILGMQLIIIALLVFITSFFLVINAFYFTEELVSFLPHPFQSYELLAAKSVNPLFYLYLINFLFYFPTLFIYGSLADAGVMYYFYGLLVYMLTPIIPFSAAALIVMFFMRFVNIAKNKDRGKIIGGIIGFAFILGINILLRLNQDSEITERITEAAAQEDGLLQIITGYYPPALLSTRTLANASNASGLFYFFVTLLLILIFLLLFYIGSQRWYFKGALGLNTGSAKAFTGKGLNTKRKAPVFSYAINEIRTILRTPTFFVQCIASALIVPALIFVLYFMDSLTSFGGILENTPGPIQVIVLLAANVLAIGLNPTANIAFSKDGSNWEAHLFLPLSFRQITAAKYAAAFAINLIPIALFYLLAILMLNLPLITAIAWILFGLLINGLVSIAGMISDLLYPKLGYTEEAELFQNRLATFFTLLITVGYTGFVLLAIYLLPLDSFGSAAAFGGTMVLLGIAAGIFVMRKLLAITDKSSLTR